MPERPFDFGGFCALSTFSTFSAFSAFSDEESLEDVFSSFDFELFTSRDSSFDFFSVAGGEGSDLRSFDFLSSFFSSFLGAAFHALQDAPPDRSILARSFLMGLGSGGGVGT
jgi:hypothetical protein